MNRMEKNIKGYLGIEYAIEDLKKICPKCHTVKEIESNSVLKAELERKQNYYAAIYNSDIPVLNGEIWIELPGWEKYSASSLGRIRLNKTDGTSEILKQYDEKGRYGYLKLEIEKNGINHSEYVYTLIAWAFLGKRKSDGKQVHHIDNNGYNCRPDNLILVDCEQHSEIHGFNCCIRKPII